METKKIIWGGLAGSVTLFLLGWILYGMVLKNFFDGQMGTATGVNKEMPDFPYLIIGQIAWGFLLARILGSWANVKSAGAGMQVGLLVGLLSAVGFDFVIFATTNISTFTGVLGDVAAWTVICGIAGLVEALVMGAGKTTA